MQLESLKIFCDVVRWASFSRGAAENGISQSSASQAVHQLEVRLGVKLIDRSKRPLVLTPQGKVYHEGCKDLVDRYLELENRVKALEDEDTVVGTVGCRRDLFGRAQSHEPVRQDIRRASSRGERTARVLAPEPRARAGDQRRGRARLAVVSAQVARAERDHLARGGDGGHGPSLAPFARRSERRGGRARWRSRSSRFDPDLSIRRAIDRFLRRHEVQVDVVLEFDNIENIKRAVEIPSGISILPEPSLAQEVKAGTLVAVPIEGDDSERPSSLVPWRSFIGGRPASSPRRPGFWSC